MIILNEILNIIVPVVMEDASIQDALIVFNQSKDSLVMSWSNVIYCEISARKPLGRKVILRYQSD